VDLEQTLTRYLAGAEAREAHQSEVTHFIRWCGRKREVQSLTGEEVAKYTQFAAGSSTDGRQRLEPVRAFLVFAYNEKLIGHKLSTYVRVSKGKGPLGEVDRSEEIQEYTLSPEAVDRLQKRLELLRVDRKRTTEEIRNAAADKDVRENAPLEAARERQGHIDSRIRELERVLSRVSHSPTAGEPSPGNRVTLGRRVRLRNLANGGERSYVLVAPPEADPLHGNLSMISPVGKALLGRRVGEEVMVETPRGTETFLVIDVE